MKTASPAQTPRELGFRMPAEWEPHEAIWLSWPHDVETFGPDIFWVEHAYGFLIAAIHATERVELLVTGEPLRQRALAVLDKAGVDLTRVRFHVFDYADVWFRDYGPIFVIRDAPPRLALVRWIFNAWGGKYEELKGDSRVPELIVSALALRAFAPGAVLEGGSIDVNGRGSALTTEQCLLNKNRNPQLSRADIEILLRDSLGISHVIWLKEGIAGDDTDGHIDDIARFVGPAKVVCALEDDASDENYRPLKDCFETLSRAQDQDGNSLEVVRLPMPEAVTAGGRRLPASYTNFYIGNGVVLVPIFGCPQDEAALSTLSRVFPGRRISPIPCRDLVRGLGPLHCISQQQPLA